MALLAPRWSETVAIFGGTFDPPHAGHREAIAGLLANPGVREVWAIPSAAPPDKPARATAEQRLAMAKLSFSDIARVDDRELKRAARTGLPSYSYDTLAEIRREIPQLAMVIGADRLGTLLQWHRFPEILKLCHWLVIERRPSGSSDSRQVLTEWEASGLAKAERTGPGSDRRWTLTGGMTLELVETPARAVSSTQIREEIGRTGLISAELLPPGVLDYLKRERLYGTRPA